MTGHEVGPHYPSMRTHTNLSLSLSLLGTGCKDPVTKDVDAEVCVPVPGEACPEADTGTSDAGEGDDDVGGTDETGGGEPVPLASDECRHNHDDYAPVIGYQYQCEGDLHTSLSFTVKGDTCEELLGGWCAQEHVFGGNFEPYAAAEVVACCGEYDYQYASTYKEFCVYDMYQQACISLAERLQASINNGDFGGYDDEAAMIQVWIANHYADCFASLLTNNSAELPDVVSHWTLGTFGDLQNVTLAIDAPTRIHGVSLPVDESEWILCDDANGNNDQVFEDGHEPDGDIVIAVNPAVDIDAELSGPLVLGGAVSASAILEASCGPRGCPVAEFSRDRLGGNFSLEELDLFQRGQFDGHRPGTDSTLDSGAWGSGV